MGEAKTAVGRIKSEWVVVDVGNTHIKIGLFIAGRLDSVNLFSPSELRSNSIPSFPPDVKFAIISVSSPALERMREIAKIDDRDVRVQLQSDGEVFRNGVVSTDVVTPETIGVDRVMGCLGALSESLDRTAIVVDCGTATTINVMTNDRCFRGGMILPGRRLLAQTLRLGTAALPEISPIDARVEIGKSTTEAINAGISAANLGGVKECIDAAQRDYPHSSVFLTGGDAGFVHKHFPHFRRVDWLTLKGLFWFAMQIGESK